MHHKLCTHQKRKKKHIQRTWRAAHEAYQRALAVLHGANSLMQGREHAVSYKVRPTVVAVQEEAAMRCVV